MMPNSVRAITVVGVMSFVVTWHRFDSATYPYSIQQPSSFQHVVLPDTDHHRVDYFFPALGSFTTNVNIYAVAGANVRNESTYLQSIRGHNVKKSGSLTINGHTVVLYRADFSGVAGNWTIEQASFRNGGLVWRITASYAHKFKKLRTTLLHMLDTFQPRS